MTDAGKTFLAKLTKRQIDLLLILCEGRSNREIGERMGVSEQVVKNYLRPMYDASGMSSRLELVMFAFHHGVVYPPSPGEKEIACP